MTTFYGDDDIDIMLEDSGVDVTIDGVQGRALIDVPDELLMQEGGIAPGVIGSMIAITVKTNAFPGIAIESQVSTADGNYYEVRFPLKVGDGALTRAMCKKL
jgi:hypothetical protein